MRHLLLILLLAFGLWACRDDEGGKGPVASPENMTFKAMTGGAVMHYTLPADQNVVGINVRYKNAFGEDMLRVGSSACDSLTLIGFKEAQNSIPARVTMSYRDGRESQPVDVTFDTDDSAPVTFIKTVECHPNWGGFALTYDVPEGANGMVHVFYLGIDPISNKADTILVNSFFLENSGGPTFASFDMTQDIDAPTVVVRVEDFLGYMVGEKSWADVPNLKMNKLDKSNFEFYCDNAQVDATYRFGPEYLFDGDTKGEILFREKGFNTFLAGPDAFGEFAHPMYIDMKEDRWTASVRLYSLLKISNGINSPLPPLMWTGAYGSSPAGLVKTYNDNEMPCEVTVYGLPDNGAAAPAYTDLNSLDGWVEIGYFKQDKATPNAQRWCVYTWIGVSWPTPPVFTTLEAVQAQPAEYMDILTPINQQSATGCRYLKIVINDCFNTAAMGAPMANTDKYAMFHELEVYTD